MYDRVNHDGKILALLYMFCKKSNFEDIYKVCQKFQSSIPKYQWKGCPNVNLSFEILEKSKWLSIEKSAESYGLTNPKPQQNNTDALIEILTKVDPSVNFDLYDGKVIFDTPNLIHISHKRS